jgi:hypothetical protein
MLLSGSVDSRSAKQERGTGALTQMASQKPSAEIHPTFTRSGRLTLCLAVIICPPNKAVTRAAATRGLTTL